MLILVLAFRAYLWSGVFGFGWPGFSVLDGQVLVWVSELMVYNLSLFPTK